MRALRQRPTTLERWPKGVHPGMVLATREDPRGGDAFFQKRVPKGAPDYVETARIEFPSGPHRRRGLPDRDRGGRVVRADGDDHVPPVAGAQRRRRPSRRAAARPRPAAGHRLRRRRARRRDRARAARRPRLRRLPEDVGRPRHPHLRPDRAALDVHRHAPRRDRVRPRARAAPARRGDDEVVEGGARRAHLRRLQPERARPDDRLGLQHPPEAGRARVGAVRVGRARATCSPRTSRSRRCRRGSPRSATRTPRSTTSRTRSSRCSTSTSEQGDGDMPYPPDYPKMPGEPKRVQPSRDRDRKQRLGRAPAAASSSRASPGRDGGGTTGPMSPSGASSRSTITGAWSLGPLPLRAWRSTHAALTRVGDVVAGEHEVDPHPAVLVEHAGAVVPVGEDALVGQRSRTTSRRPTRLERGERLALGRRDVRLADVGVGVEDVVVGRRDVHVAAARPSTAGRAATIAVSASSHSSLYA